MIISSIITNVLSFVFPAIASIEVNTTTGLIRGKENCYRNTKYISFEGIRYAEPPIGKLRFMPPVPVKPWKGVFNATAPGPACPQLVYFHERSEMDEDCTFLNIYVPVNSCKKLMPVFIFIHGGYYSLGSGRPTPVNGPQLLLEKGFIVVFPNYRLGALGFLSLGIREASGNVGLKDILLALKWTKENIKKFGGDPNSISLNGGGTGAALIHHLLLTEQSKDLFQSALIMSGSALSPRALQINPRDNVLKLAKQLNIRCKDNSCLLQKLKKIDAFKIIDAQEHIIRNDPRRAFILRDLFCPVIEQPSPTAIITKHPLEVIRKECLVQKVPIITGFNDQEGLEIFFILKDQYDLIEKLNKNFELCIPSDIQYPQGSQMRKDLAASIKKFYFNNCDINIFNVQNYINLITDTSYSYNIDYWINLCGSKTNTSSIYYYYFEYDGGLNWAKLFKDITYPGAAHGDDLGYILLTNVTECKIQNIDVNTKKVSEKILTHLKNLPVFGDPTPPQFGGFQWAAFGPKRDYLRINPFRYNVRGPPIPERIYFWRKVYEKYYEYERLNKTKI